MSPSQGGENGGPTPLDLYSLRHLEALLGHTRIELGDLAKRAVHYYEPFPFRKPSRPFSRKQASGKKRWIDNPVDPLKAVQSRIEQRLLKRVVLPEHLLGGVKGRSSGAVPRHDRHQELFPLDNSASGLRSLAKNAELLAGRCPPFDWTYHLPQQAAPRGADQHPARESGLERA
jgi:hypothetical protein